MEIVYGVELTGMPVRDYLQMLRDNGSTRCPGTAAEILDDEVRPSCRATSFRPASGGRSSRPRINWDSLDIDLDVRTRGDTGALGEPDPDVPRNSEQTGGFTEFVPLGFVHQNTLLFQQGLARSGPTLAEHLKIHALARSCWRDPSTTSRFRG